MFQSFQSFQSFPEVQVKMFVLFRYYSGILNVWNGWNGLERDERSEERVLDGVVRFPPEFAARYRAKGYWEDRSLRDIFDELFARHADRVAVIDRDQSVTYAQIDQRSTRLALNLLDEGLKPLDRVVVQLPNVVEFVYLYFALQKIGGIPIMALPTHRFREMSQFIELSGAVACATPDKTKDFDYRELVRRIRASEQNSAFGNYFGRRAGRVFVVDRTRRATQQACAR